MFKWLCLLVAVVALSVYGWMLNDMRLEVKALAPKVERLVEKTEELVEKADNHLPQLLVQTGQVTTQLDRNLPRLLTQAEQAGKTINTHLPVLLDRSEIAVDNLADLSDSFKQYKGLMGVVHAATSNKGLFSY